MWSLIIYASLSDAYSTFVYFRKWVNLFMAADAIAVDIVAFACSQIVSEHV
jgi:hypothetical protein